MLIRDCVHSGLCPFGMVSIRDGVHSGLCPFGMVSIRDCVHSGWCPFGMVSIRDRVIRDCVFWDCIHLGNCPDTAGFTLACQKQNCGNLKLDDKFNCSHCQCICCSHSFVNKFTFIRHLKGNVNESNVTILSNNIYSNEHLLV